MDKNRPHLSHTHTVIKHRQKSFSFDLKPPFHLSFGLHCCSVSVNRCLNCNQVCTILSLHTVSNITAEPKKAPKTPHLPKTFFPYSEVAQGMCRKKARKYSNLNYKYTYTASFFKKTLLILKSVALLKKLLIFLFFCYKHCTNILSDSNNTPNTNQYHSLLYTKFYSP